MDLVAFLFHLNIYYLITARPDLALPFWLLLCLGTLYRWGKYQNLFWEHLLFKELLFLPLRTGTQTWDSRWICFVSPAIAGHKVGVGFIPSGDEILPCSCQWLG